MICEALATAGTRVRIRTDPGRIGVLTGKTRESGNCSRLQVQFPDQPQYVPADQLEVVDGQSEHPFDLLASGRFSGPAELRRCLTHARVSGRLSNIIYSMDTTGADFYAYQFKPLVKLLNSATTGILIADEVGLGKTIEAGLIWTEFRSRFDFRRLLVLCPAFLREKWRRELKQRFGVKATVVDAKELQRHLREARDYPDSTEFALIASFQGVRDRKEREGHSEKKQFPATELAQFLDDEAGQAALIDLTIIDEAHYMRNIETKTANVGHRIRAISEYVVLLSATPIHLHQQDLFELLRLADPATFDQPSTFNAIMHANRPLVAARDLVANRNTTAHDVSRLLRKAQQNYLLAESRQLERLIEEVTEARLDDPVVAAQIAAGLESVNLLGHVLTRTRKRDVHEWRVQRVPKDEPVTLAEDERQFYDEVTRIVREYCAQHGTNDGFLAVMPQRQMSSSMAAAYRSWSQRLPIDFEDADEVDPDLDRKRVGPVIMELAKQLGVRFSFDRLCEIDSKYLLLRKRIREILSANPEEKLVLFSSFRTTLDYLHERLKQDGIHSLLLHGGTKDKDATVDEFRETARGTVLLAGEVASEGIDLQFANKLINYDLPWNPMRIEQRIGRLDRLGQQHPKVAIWNLFHADTIDARIYLQLIIRLDIFKTFIGSNEPVLALEIRRLERDLISISMSPEEEVDRIRQTEMAIANKLLHEEQLESEAAQLIAHGDHILAQIQNARAVGRKIQAAELLNYVIEFLYMRYPGCECRQISEDFDFEIRLSPEAKADLDRFLQSRRLRDATTLSRPTPRPVRCRFTNSVVGQRDSKVELLNQHHPLVRFVSECLTNDALLALRPAVAARVDAESVPLGIAPGKYVFVVESFTMEGLQPIKILSFAVASTGADPTVLPPEVAEQLIHAAADHGRDWYLATNDFDLDEVCRIVEEICLPLSGQFYERKVEELSAQNDDRASLQERSLDLDFERHEARLNRDLDTHRQHGRKSLVAATEGRLRALTERVERKRADIRRRRKFTADREEICVGTILVEDAHRRLGNTPLVKGER